MTQDPELLAILACPKCKTPMEPEGGLSLRSDESGFECAKCRLFFKIEDGIPNFLLEEATSLDS